MHIPCTYSKYSVCMYIYNIYLLYVRKNNCTYNLYTYKYIISRFKLNDVYNYIYLIIYIYIYLASSNSIWCIYIDILHENTAHIFYMHHDNLYILSILWDINTYVYMSILYAHVNIWYIYKYMYWYIKHIFHSPKRMAARLSETFVIKNIMYTKQKETTWATKKNPYYFPLYWFVNRDPYNGLL